MRGWVMLLVVVTLGGACRPAGSEATAETSIHLSPDGDDGNPGTRERPLASLERARDVARALGPGRTKVTITLAAGHYGLERTFELDARDSHLSFVASAGEVPVLSGGIPVRDWVAEGGDRWRAPLEVDELRQLWIDRRRARRARGVPPADLRLAGNLEEIDGRAGYLTADATLLSLTQPSALELGFFGTWSHKICGVEAIHPPSAPLSIEMRQPCFFLITHDDGRPVSQPTYMENALELLDEPGEWFFDRARRVLHYLAEPGIDLPRAEVIAPLLERLVVVRGAEDIHFVGITFADAAWLRPSTYGHPDVQVNFVADARDGSRLFRRDGRIANAHNEYWKTPAAVVLEGVRSSSIERCTFTRLGGSGLDLEAGSSDNLVRGNRIFDVSANGIQIGDVLQPDHHPTSPGQIVRGNQIIDNYVHHVGVQYEDSAAIFVGYTEGTVVAHNEVACAPFMGISVGWGWGEEDAGGGSYPQPFFYESPTPSGANQVVNNHVHHVMQRRSDGGGIYLLGNQPGTVVASNHVHGNGQWPGGIYLDEGAGFIEITGNSVHDVAEPIFFNNQAQGRQATCREHDNFWNSEVEVGAGLSPPYRDLLMGPDDCDPRTAPAMQPP